MSRLGLGRTLGRVVGVVVAFLGSLVAGCGPAKSPLAFPQAPIDIVAPAKPLDAPIYVRQGPFQRSKANPEGVLFRFRKELAAANIFSAVLDAPGADEQTTWEIRVGAADYGEVDAYTFELQGALVRSRELVASYGSKQSVKGQPGTQLTITGADLGKLVERAIRDMVRQIAADSEKLRAAK
jgi:hypothetical protein